MSINGQIHKEIATGTYTEQHYSIFYTQNLLLPEDIMVNK